MLSARRVALAALLLTGVACQGPPTKFVVPEPEVVVGPPAYGAFARAREEDLRVRLLGILTELRPRVAEIEDALHASIDGLPTPLRLATKEPFLRRWGSDLQEAFQARVQAEHAAAREQLVVLYEEAMELGLTQARSLAPQASPLDSGATGSALLDADVGAFAQSLDELIDFAEMDVRLQQDVLRRDELVEVFSTLGVEGADKQLGGRLTLFVGGAQDNAGPRARVVLRCDEGVDAEERGFYQVARHRVMRGPTTVHDTGWRAMGRRSGVPTLELAGAYLVGSSVAPALLDEHEDFAKLHDMRVLVDVQTGVYDATTKLLGGVDWQLEFRVSSRGGVSWQLSGAGARFNPSCEELREIAADQRRRRGA